MLLFLERTYERTSGWTPCVKLMTTYQLGPGGSKRNLQLWKAALSLSNTVVFKNIADFIINQFNVDIIDPRGHPSRSYLAHAVRHFSSSGETNHIFLSKYCLILMVTKGMAKWIIDNSCLVLLLYDNILSSLFVAKSR